MRRVDLLGTSLTATVAVIGFASACGSKVEVPMPAPTGREAGTLPQTSECPDASAADASAPSFGIFGCRRQGVSGALAVFGWSNRTGETIVVAFGLQNQVAPGEAAQGQPESYPLGTSGSFAVAFSGTSVTWNILGQSVAVDTTSVGCAPCVQAELVGPDAGVVDICAEACGDGTCNATETCRACSKDCDCSDIEPLVECVAPMSDGGTLASFGYRNLAVRGGRYANTAENSLSPGEPMRGQPTLFRPGETHHAFRVAFTGPELTWTVGTRAVTATPSTSPCKQNCATCPDAGTTCVESTCVEICGDGQCTSEENCLSCPADCGCGTGRTCAPTGGCFVLPQCGRELDCGRYERHGVRIECGACSAGRHCVANQCVAGC